MMDYILNTQHKIYNMTRWIENANVTTIVMLIAGTQITNSRLQQTSRPLATTIWLFVGGTFPSSLVFGFFFGMPRHNLTLLLCTETKTAMRIQTVKQLGKKFEENKKYENQNQSSLSDSMIQVNCLLRACSAVERFQ